MGSFSTFILFFSKVTSVENSLYFIGCKFFYWPVVPFEFFIGLTSPFNLFVELAPKKNCFYTAGLFENLPSFQAMKSSMNKLNSFFLESRFLQADKEHDH